MTGLADNEEESRTFSSRVKILVVGDKGVGKTSLVKRFSEGSFFKTYVPTEGVDFFHKRVILREVYEVSIQLLDLSGDALVNKTSLKIYSHGSQAVMIVYDSTQCSSLANVTQWVTELKSIPALQGDEIFWVLAANKNDLQNVTTCSSQMHKDTIVTHQLSGYVVSARTGEGVNECFLRIVATVLGIQMTQNDLERSKTILRTEIDQVHDDSEEDSTESQKTAEDISTSCTLL
ncbi:hypothetical protein CRM22_007320 [Opisthorchis felineus]|uniref:Uncharacterized protein n=1 Tax=Opisthorchis felineus TaxID=147828 RepID=A0A4S2LNC1_OPIFE|nr:hypothetical protein CRM22_007320 [Opisthorchis felineus]